MVLSADVYDAMFGNYAPAKAGTRWTWWMRLTRRRLWPSDHHASGRTDARHAAQSHRGTLKSGNHEPQSGDAYAIVNHATNGNAAIKTAIGGLNNLSSGDVGTAVGTALGSYGAAKSTDLGDIESVTDKLGTMTESDGEGGYRYTETALENAPTGGGGGGSGELTDGTGAQADAIRDWDDGGRPCDWYKSRACGGCRSRSQPRGLAT